MEWGFMPRVELNGLNIKPEYNIVDFNLFLPFCIHESEAKMEVSEYDTEYFKQTIEQTRGAYPGKLLNILVADTLDRHNRSNPNDNTLTEDELSSMSESERDARDQRIAGCCN
jgi:hypothetical protein